MGLFDTGGFRDWLPGVEHKRGLGDSLARQSGRERNTWEGFLDPLDLLQLGDPIKSPLEMALENIGAARFENPEIQMPFLPAVLRTQNINRFLDPAIKQLGQLLTNPGGIGSNLQSAIAPRLEAERAQIGQNFQNIKSEAAGSAARTNTPVSLKGALSKALDTAEARAQRQAGQQAVAESEEIRRQDVPQAFNILDAILQFTSSGRGQAVSGLGGAGQLDLQSRGIQQQQNAAALAGLGSLANSLSGFNFGGGGGGNILSGNTPTGEAPVIFNNPGGAF